MLSGGLKLVESCGKLVPVGKNLHAGYVRYRNRGKNREREVKQ